MLDTLKNALKSVTNVHRPGPARDVLLFATPRGGSTWLTELIASQPGTKLYNEPFDLRKPTIRRQLGIDDWTGLYDPAADAKIHRYLRAVHDGRFHYGDANPFRRATHRLRSERIVFKIIHAGEDRIGRIADALDAHVVILLRHPIAVSLSREVLPRLDALLERARAEGLVAPDQPVVEEVLARGSELERGVLDWCLQTAFALRDRRAEWTVVTYEQLVLDPEPAVRHLADALGLPDRERIMARLGEASAVKHKSDEETRRLLDRSGSREALVRKWTKRVSAEQEARAMRLLDAFGLDAYRSGSALPDDALWIRRP